MGSPISPRLILAGEACESTMPAMVNGAFVSGQSAATFISTKINEINELNYESFVIIGAGAAGLAAAKKLKQLNPCCHVLVLEARNRIGGRVHTVDSLKIYDSENILVDSGATWLQQFPSNILAPIAEEEGLTLISTDFNNVLCGASDHVPISNLNEITDKIVTENENFNASLAKDVSFLNSIESYLSSCNPAEKRLANIVLGGDIMADSGLALDKVNKLQLQLMNFS